MNRISARIGKLSLRAELLLILLLGIIVAALGAWMGYYATLEEYSQTLQQRTAATLSVYGSNVSDEMAGCFDQLRQQAMDSVFQDGVDVPHDSAYPQWVNSIRNAAGTVLGSQIIGVFFYGDDGTLCTSGNVSVSSQALQDLCAALTDVTSTEAWVSAGVRDSSLLIGKRIYSARPATFMNPIGTLIYRVNLRGIIRNRAGVDAGDESTSALYLSDGTSLIYPADSDLTPEDAASLAAVRPADAGYQVLTVAGESYFSVTNTLRLGRQSCLLTLLMPYDDLIRSIQGSLLRASLLMGSAMLLALLLTGRMSRGISRSVGQLLRKMDDFQAGRYTPAVNDPPPTRNELALLDHSFDVMAAAYQKMIDENYVKELLLTQAQLHNLEQQLDPHFLYNTLETISFFAKRNGDEQIPVITGALVELLQASIRCQEDCVPLRWELKLVDDYLRIQQIRFADILTAEVSADDALLDTRMPKMSLQPLVENAIRYTLEEEETCALRVTTCTDTDGTVCVQVWDNGPPLDPALMEQLRRKERPVHGNGIGLVNIDTRTKLLFGDRYGLSFHNEGGQACVTLRVPPASTQKEENHDAL